MYFTRMQCEVEQVLINQSFIICRMSSKLQSDFCVQTKEMRYLKMNKNKINVGFTSIQYFD